MRKKRSRKYILIAKADINTFVKYRSDNYINTISFLQKKYTKFCFANIYSNTGADKGKLIYTFGKLKGLQPAY